MCAIITYILVLMCGAKSFYTRQEASRWMDALVCERPKYHEAITREFFWDLHGYPCFTQFVYKQFEYYGALDQGTIDWALKSKDPEVVHRVRYAIRGRGRQ
jgi:hypothetical protein